MKSHTYIFLFFFCLIIACNEEEINSLPSEFEITVDEINYTSAIVSWSESASNLPNTITYDILLNNNLIVENFEETTYLLEGLLPNTVYTIKVIAKNEIGETTISQEIITPELMPVRLSTITTSYEFTDLITTIEYNDQGQILSRKKVWSHNDYVLLEYTYEYNGPQLNSAFTGNNYYLGVSDGVILDYYYNNEDNLKYLIAYEIDDIEGIERIHTFNSPTEYEYEKIDHNYEAPPTSTYHSVDLTINENNELINYLQNNITEGTTQSLSFQYENNNLTKITNENNVFEIVYDESPTYLTFSHNGYVNDEGDGAQYRIIAGFPVVTSNNFPFHTIRRIPYFLTHSNNNNPLQYIRNGQVIADFEYTYNVYGYPETMTVIRPNDENYTYSMVYEEID